jgi:hypothetical protein
MPKPPSHGFEPEGTAIESYTPDLPDVVGVNNALKQIACASCRQDQLRIAGIFFKLGPQPRDVDIYHAGIHMALGGVAPHFLQNLSP